MTYYTPNEPNTESEECRRASPCAQAVPPVEQAQYSGLAGHIADALAGLSGRLRRAVSADKHRREFRPLADLGC